MATLQSELHYKVDILSDFIFSENLDDPVPIAVSSLVEHAMW